MHFSSRTPQRVEFAFHPHANADMQLRRFDRVESVKEADRGQLSLNRGLE